MRKCFTIIITLTLLIISCSSSEKSAKRLYDKGIQALNAGDSEKALEIFESIITDYPKQPYGLFGKAVYYDKEELVYRSFDAVNKVLVEHPKFLPALFLNSGLYLKIHRPELAFYYITHYQNDGGDLVTGVTLEVDALLMAGKIEDAFETVQRGLDKRNDDPLLHAVRGQCYLHAGDFENGLKDCAYASSATNATAKTYATIGSCYKLIGLFDSAACYYEKALQVSGDDLYFKTDMAAAFIGLDYYHEARDLLREFKQRAPNSHRYYLLSADIYKRQGRIRNAMHEYGMIVQKYNHSPFVLGHFAKYKAKLRDKLGSQQYFESAQIFTARDKYPRAAIFDVSLNYLEMLIDARRIDMAGPLMESILDSLPNDFRTLQSATFLYWVREAEDKLRKVIKRLPEAAKGSSTNMAKMGELFITMDSLDNAHDVFVDVLKHDKLSYRAILGEVEIIKRKMGQDEALAFINSLDEYLSYNPEIAQKKLELYEELGDNDAALQYVEQLIEIGSRDIDRYRQAIRLAEELGYEDKMREIYNACIENNAEDPDAYFLSANHFFDIQDYPKAEENIFKALSLDSLHVSSLTLQADLEAVRGHVDSAIAIYKKAIELDQYYSMALGNLALVMLENNIKVKSTVTLANKAIYHDPANARHRNTLGRIKYALGRYKSAAVSFKNALRFDPENPEYIYNAGINYIKTKNPDKAREYLKKAIKKGLSGDLKVKAKKALKKL